MPFLPELNGPSADESDYRSSCLALFYFFVACYVVCVCFLLYTLVRLLTYYLRHSNERLHPATTTLLVRIHELAEASTMAIKSELDVCQPLILPMHDLPPIYMEVNREQRPLPPPPDYKEQL